MKRLIFKGLLVMSLFLGYSLFLGKIIGLDAGVLSIEEMEQISAGQACPLCARSCKQVATLDCITDVEITRCYVDGLAGCDGSTKCTACVAGVSDYNTTCEGERNKCGCEHGVRSCAHDIPGYCTRFTLEEGGIVCRCLEIGGMGGNESCGPVWYCRDWGTCIPCESE